MVKTHIFGMQPHDQSHHFSLSFCFSSSTWTAVPVTRCSLGVRAGALSHSFPHACHPHCIIFPERSCVQCCTPGVRALGVWREEGVLPWKCSAVIRLSQLKDFFMQVHWGIDCYSFSICLSTMVFKLQCRLVRKYCFFTWRKLGFSQVFCKALKFWSCKILLKAYF